MRSLQLAAHLSNAAVQTQLVNARGTADHNRWQIIYLIQIGGQHRAEVIAPLVNLTVHSIYKIVEKYNRHGVAAIACRPRGGRKRSFLSLKEEKDLFGSLEQMAARGLIKTANDMRKVVETKVGRSVSDDYLWDLFHRHGWKKKMPRPHHPKRSVAEQAEFKKNFPKIWTPLQ
jgi:transposase